MPKNIRCPKCGSKVIADKRKPFVEVIIVISWILIFTIPLAIFLIATARQKQCMSCGHVFD